MHFRFSSMVKAAVALCLLGCAAAAAAAHNSGAPRLSAGNPDQLVGLANVGQQWNDGMVVLRNQGPVAATLDRIELVGALSGTGVRRAYIRPLLGRRSINSGNWQWPPAGITLDQLRPLRGAISRPDRAAGTRANDLEVIVRLSLPRHVGRYGFRALRLRYHYGRHRGSQVLPHALIVCIGGRPAGTQCRS
jgi:hypothetical protein